MITERTEGKTKLLSMRSRQLLVEFAPQVGGRMVKLQNLETGRQFLWKNPSLDLEKLPAGSEYDSNFYGGIDELLPNDMPEEINGVDFPDHGELWTLALDWKETGEGVTLSGRLPLCGLNYEKTLELAPDRPELIIRYRISNPTASAKPFLWKFHAALEIDEGDEIICPAETAVVADPQWSKWKSTEPFPWPAVQGQRADRIPGRGAEVDFLYLYNLKTGCMGWRRPGEDAAFAYFFDKNVFPYCWYFASYGGFYGHYTAVLEPCTAMPCSVREAHAQGQCSVLEGGEALETTVRIYAGTGSGLERIWKGAE